MSLLRAFIAVEIPHTIQLAIRHATSALRDELKDSVRWTPVENVHLTLKFLGDISPADIDELTRVLRSAADKVPAFDLHVSGLGSFPNSKMPRIVWAGIQAPAGLEALRQGIESDCKGLGFVSETRAFSPHLTVGRVRQNASPEARRRIRHALEGLTIDSLGTARVDSVHLFKSELKPVGAVYSKLFSMPLKIPVVE